MTYFGHFNQPIIHNLTTTVIACFCFINVFLTTNLQIGNYKCRFSNHLWVEKVEAAKKIFSLLRREGLLFFQSPCLKRGGGRLGTKMWVRLNLIRGLNWTNERHVVVVCFDFVLLRGLSRRWCGLCTAKGITTWGKVKHNGFYVG